MSYSSIIYFIYKFVPLPVKIYFLIRKFPENINNIGRKLIIKCPLSHIDNDEDCNCIPIIKIKKEFEIKKKIIKQKKIKKKYRRWTKIKNKYTKRMKNQKKCQ